MSNLPYDQAIARVLVKPLIKTPIHPNHITIFSFVLGVAGSLMMLSGDYSDMGWGATIFVIARFLDHFDGELARASGKKTRIGYYLDYFVGGSLHAIFFACIGIGLQTTWLGDWSLALGAAGFASSVIAMFLNLKLDAAMELEDGATVGYPGIWRFELEDGIYLIAPVAWSGWLDWFFIAVGVGAVAYLVWTAFSLIRVISKRKQT
ncbi:MAG: CDP-alcohol phosphatidyltransferase family protein [Rhodospirillales bacterium]